MSFTWEELEAMRPKGDWHVPVPPTCGRCDYVLTGLPENRCPECGTVFHWHEVSRRAARTWSLANRLRHANQDAVTGIIIGLSGWFVLGLFLLLGWDNCLIRFGTLIFSGFTLILGSQVLNLRRVPPWARVIIGDPPPNVWLGAAALFLGLTLLVGTLTLWV